MLSVMTARRFPLLGVLALSLSLAVAGCGGDDEGGGGEDGGEPVVEAPALSPLTGLPVVGEPGHPVLAVKIDNSSSSAPQLGLGGAGMVVEELVEGGMTRLAVFYYNDVPEDVGPVRSMRATDIGIVSPLGAALVASGGAPQTVERIKDADIKTFTEGAQGYYRDSDRSAPYNLFMRLDQLARKAKATETPEPYLPFEAGTRLPAGKPASGLTASFSAGSSTTFEHRGNAYVNLDTFAAEGDTFDPSTVLVLRVPVGDAGYLDPAGNPVPETKFTGRGQALIFHDGEVVKGDWVKSGLSGTVELQVGGKAVSLPPGKVWIELVPQDGGDVSWTR
jgi:Protein of unknown function (DUF3048) N-terminal domain/Protein of unknown function (DUF3048) C-terminal domain